MRVLSDREREIYNRVKRIKIMHGSKNMMKTLLAKEMNTKNILGGSISRNGLHVSIKSDKKNLFGSLCTTEKENAFKENLKACNDASKSTSRQNSKSHKTNKTRLFCKQKSYQSHRSIKLLKSKTPRIIERKIINTKSTIGKKEIRRKSTFKPQTNKISSGNFSVSAKRNKTLLLKKPSIKPGRSHTARHRKTQSIGDMPLRIISQGMIVNSRKQQCKPNIKRYFLIEQHLQKQAQHNSSKIISFDDSFCKKSHHMNDDDEAEIHLKVKHEDQRSLMLKNLNTVKGMMMEIKRKRFSSVDYETVH